MGMTISSKQAQSACKSIVEALNSTFGDDDLVAEIRNKTGGKKKHAYVFVNTPPGIWRKVAKWLKKNQGIDYCSMITGINWPEKDKEYFP